MPRDDGGVLEREALRAGDVVGVAGEREPDQVLDRQALSLHEELGAQSARRGRLEDLGDGVVDDVVEAPADEVVLEDVAVGLEARQAGARA